MRSLHPFPARMAPDLALSRLEALPERSVVLDPMAGSGTVLRQACDLGHMSIGFDVDPLAVMMASVWTTVVSKDALASLKGRLKRELCKLSDDAIDLPWIDDDEETATFIRYWFGVSQQRDLRRFAYVLNRIGRYPGTIEPVVLNVARIALSRIIVTKEQRASLARDTSHSRPHRVAETSDFDVAKAYWQSFRQVSRYLEQHPPQGRVRIASGDARSLSDIRNGSVDAILTSPPYLNAIDYLRGHKFSLVWLGHRLSELRAIRSGSVGAERAPTLGGDDPAFASIRDAMGDFRDLPKRYNGMIDRYCQDLYRMMSEARRVMKAGAKATYVIGNNCVRGVFVSNADGLIRAAELQGLRLVSCTERELPPQSRYLPISGTSSLSKRMRTEAICTFEK